jgi:hypothetical protein
LVLVRGSARTIAKPRSLGPAVLLASLHHPHKAADPVDLLSVHGAKLPEA